jgi:hypothetical protein
MRCYDRVLIETKLWMLTAALATTLHRGEQQQQQQQQQQLGWPGRNGAKRA